MKNRLTTCLLTLGACLVSATAFAQSTTTSTPPADSSVAGFFVGIAQGYPWLATILLVIGGFRVVFKPLMTLLDAYIKENCSSEEYAKLQTFETGPVFKWLNFAIDLFGSVKLPVVGIKPAARPDQTSNS